MLIKRYKLIALPFLLLMLILAACQSSPSPTAAVPEVLENQPAITPTPPQENPPASPQSYPNPIATSEEAYPGPEGSESVEWEQVRAMILNGEVTRVIQEHSVQVIVYLKDGRVLVTTEPATDEVFRVIDECGDPCKDILRS